jgi:hypothetical protein
VGVLPHRAPSTTSWGFTAPRGFATRWDTGSTAMECPPGPFCASIPAQGASWGDGTPAPLCVREFSRPALREPVSSWRPALYMRISHHRPFVNRFHHDVRPRIRGFLALFLGDDARIIERLVLRTRIFHILDVGCSDMSPAHVSGTFLRNKPMSRKQVPLSACKRYLFAK